MLKFELKQLETVVGRQHFFELIIDGKSQYEQFSKEIASNPPYVSEQKTILTNMNIVANLGALPEKNLGSLKDQRVLKNMNLNQSISEPMYFILRKQEKL